MFPCLVLSVALLASGVGSAQEFRATVTGRVADPNLLAVPGATVTILNTQTGEVASGVTTREGAYTHSVPQAGHLYRVGGAEGFRKATRTNVQLEVGQTRGDQHPAAGRRSSPRT